MSHSFVGSPSSRGFVVARPLDFSCTLRQSGREVAWVRLAGELDITTSPKLRETLRGAETFERIVVDLRPVSFIDTAGVHVIVDAATELRRAGRRLVLVRGPADVDRMFDLTGTSDMLEIVDLSPAEPPVGALLKLAQRERVT